MAWESRTHAIIRVSLMLIVGIIHFGVGVGIVSKYHDYQDVFQQQVALSGYNIFVGICAIIIGIISLFAVLKRYSLLSRIMAILMLILTIIAFASLVAALALSSNSPKYLRDTISDNMNDYTQDQDSIDIIDSLQTKYQCCGVNLWLDWARISLGVTNNLGVGRRRRRQYSSVPISPLARALRQKRQIVSTNTGVYNLPSTYSVNLPLSCCKSGGVSNANSLGAFCQFNANNNTNSFYVSGCLVPVASIAFSQITGIAVINTALTLIALACFAKLLNLFPSNSGPDTKETNENEVDQERQSQPHQQQQPPYYQQQQPWQQQDLYKAPVRYYNSAPYYSQHDSTYRIYL